jgi:hypothetical protein
MATRKPADDPAVITLRLAPGVNAAQVHMDGSEVELSADKPTVTVSDQRRAAELLRLPFLIEDRD